MIVFCTAASSLHDTTSQASPMDEGSVHRIPFAIIDEISDASPAAEDGLQLGDMIVKFGNVESGDSLHSRLALEAQSNEGHPVPLQIMRQGSLLNLTVTPKQWHGRGLLGYVPYFRQILFHELKICMFHLVSLRLGSLHTGDIYIIFTWTPQSILKISGKAHIIFLPLFLTVSFTL